MKVFEVAAGRVATKFVAVGVLVTHGKERKCESKRKCGRRRPSRGSTGMGGRIHMGSENATLNESQK